MRGYICARLPDRQANTAHGTMTDFWFGFGHIAQKLLGWFITPWGWGPVTIFTIVMALGSIYWLMLQSRYNRRAKEKGEHI